MRTTLTIDDDLARQLTLKAELERRSFKDVVNETLRRGLGVGSVLGKKRRFKVVPKHCGFRPGIDIGKLNQLNDELEIDHLIMPMDSDKT